MFSENGSHKLKNYDFINNKIHIYSILTLLLLRIIVNLVFIYNVSLKINEIVYVNIISYKKYNNVLKEYDSLCNNSYKLNLYLNQTDLNNNSILTAFLDTLFDQSTIINLIVLLIN
jgi:hypothetical protein